MPVVSEVIPHLPEPMENTSAQVQPEELTAGWPELKILSNPLNGIDIFHS